MFEERPEDHPSPIPIDRPIGFRYHFIEVCGGAGRVPRAVAAFGWVVGPNIDLSFSSAYDLASPVVLDWLVHMLTSGRLDALMVEPPCSTFSLAAYILHAAATLSRLDFLPLLRALLLLHFCAITGALGLLEQPLLSKMAFLRQWILLRKRPNVTEHHTVSCEFGSPLKKPFRLLAVNLDGSCIERKMQRKPPPC